MNPQNLVFEPGHTLDLYTGHIGLATGQIHISHNMHVSYHNVQYLSPPISAIVLAANVQHRVPPISAIVLAGISLLPPSSFHYYFVVILDQKLSIWLRRSSRTEMNI
jgi:hypothetical protein